MQSSYISFKISLIILTFVSIVHAQLSRSSLMTLKDHVQYKDYFCVAKCLGLINQKCNPAPVPPTPASILSTGLPPQSGAVMGKSGRSGEVVTTTKKSSGRSFEKPKARRFGKRGKRSSHLAPLDFGPPLNCSALSFVGMAECCEETPREFVFSKEDVEFCHGTSVEKMPYSLVESVWEYILNQIQTDPFGPGSIDLTRPYARKKFGAKVNFDNNRFIDFKHVATDLSASVSEEWQVIVNEAVVNCSSSLNGLPIKISFPYYPVVHPITTIELREGYQTTICRTQPFILLQCLRRSLLMECPSPNKRVKSIFCDLSNQNLPYCDPFKY